ncbi:MAG: hypothetical protein ACF8PN_01360 [Phycisphaerales bacterium]
MAHLTDRTAQETYRDARRALNNIARSLVATNDQVDEARAARTRLSDEFIGETLDAIADRTIQFESFIEIMDETIARIGRDSPIHALGTLKDIVKKARDLADRLTTA